MLSTYVWPDRVVDARRAVRRRDERVVRFLPARHAGPTHGDESDAECLVCGRLLGPGGHKCSLAIGRLRRGQRFYR